MTQLQTSSRIVAAATLRPRCGWNPPPEPLPQPEAVLRPRTTALNPLPPEPVAHVEERVSVGDGSTAARPESATSTTSRPSRSRARPTSGLSGPVSRLADRSAAGGINVSPQSRGDQAPVGVRPLSAQSTTSTKTDVLREELSRQKLEQVGRHLRGKGDTSSVTSFPRGTPAGSTGVSLAGTRPSSPVPPELTEAMDIKDLEIRKRLAEAQNPQDIEEQLSLKERQVLEIRAQITRCEKQLYGDNFAGPRAEADVVEDPKRDPERTGPRSPALSSASAATMTSKSNNLEAELAWTVRQMEVHRRQIQAHQLQLGALEKRHAEIITVLAAQASRSPTADPADSLASSQPEVPTADRLSIHPSNPFAQVGKDLGPATKSAPSAWSRPSSAGSHAHRPSSAGSQAHAAHRPSSASSHQHSLLEEVQEKRPLQSATAPSDGVVASAVDSIDSGKPAVLPESKPSSAQAGDPRLTTRTFSKAYEAERIVFLLTQFGCRRPLRVPFIPMDDQSEGEGRPYLHGSFEVRLCLTPDGNDLLVRVGADAHGDGGRVMAIDEFVDRAEASEARRVQRPIAEEGEFVGGSTPFMPSPPQSGYRETSSIQNLLGGKDASLQAGSNNPWKKLFKAHWAPK